MSYNKITSKDLEQLRSFIRDEDRFITKPTVHWDHDQFKTVRAMPDLVIQPTTNEEVEKVVKYASDHHIPIVPRGNSTGLMGANLSVDGGISLDMVKMNKILSYEPNNLTMTVQAGIRLKDMEEFLADKPFTYMPAPAMHWATIGGNVDTNAGGLKAIKYGVTREHIRELKVVLAVVTASGQVMLPHIANKFSKGDVKGIRESLYNSFDFITAMAVPMMFGIMAIAEPFAPWFLGAEFNDAGKLMMIEAPIILFIGWSNVTGTQYLMPINRTREYTISVTIGAVINIIANFLLIAKWGASGAALATDISELAVTVVQLVYIRTTIQRRRLFGSMWKYLLSGLIMFIIVYRLSNVIQMTIANLILEVALGAVVYIFALFLFHAPIIEQAQEFINSRKAKRK